jgi:hypothetical protein
MKIWNMIDPQDQRFAQAWLRGPWVPENSPGLCQECGSSQQVRGQPMGMEWEEGTALIGDFVWPSGFDLAIQETVFDRLLQQFHGFEKGLITMYQDPKLKKPTRITKRTKPRIWLPYDGPVLFDLWITKIVPMHPNTTAVLVKACHTCGMKKYRLKGVEIWKHKYDKSLRKRIEVHQERVPEQGLFVSKIDLGDADIFRVANFRYILCTDRVKEFIEREGFSNVKFLEYGEVLAT